MWNLRAVPAVLLSSVLLLAAAIASGPGCGSSAVGTQATLGPSGGSLSLPSAGVRLDVPAGALSATTTITLRAARDSQSLLVALEPSQLALGRAATLAVQFQGAVHIASVSEVASGGEHPLGLDSRVENSTGAQARLRLDHLTQVRLSTGSPADGGEGQGACRGDEDGEHPDGGEHHGDDARAGASGGETWDGGAADGGRHDDGDDGEDDDEPRDGGTVAGTECPAGFECDDGVCVAPGGDHEGDDDGSCGLSDGGTNDGCPPASHCSDGRCKPDSMDGGG